jgi:hypothetical protein
MEKERLGILPLTLKTIVVHTITYFLVGIIAFNLFDYAEGFTIPELACWMRPTNEPIVTAGVLFQPIRGIIFALVFFPLQEILFNRKYGWLITFWLLFGLGILNTFGPAPGSIEGMVYTILPLSITTYLETTVQSFLLAGLLYYWINHPEKKWLSWVFGIIFGVVILLPIMGLLFGNIS